MHLKNMYFKKRNVIEDKFLYLKNFSLLKIHTTKKLVSRYHLFIVLKTKRKEMKHICQYRKIFKT